MANLQVKNVPVELYEELRRRSASQHLTMRDYVLALLRKDQELPTLEDWLGTLPKAPITRGAFDARALVETARSERHGEQLPDVEGTLDG